MAIIFALAISLLAKFVRPWPLDDSFSVWIWQNCNHLRNHGDAEWQANAWPKQLSSGNICTLKVENGIPIPKAISV